MTGDPLLQFPVSRIRDNRIKGLLRELAEAIDAETDPATLRSVGISLKMLGDYARGKGYRNGGKFY